MQRLGDEFEPRGMALIQQAAIGGPRGRAAQFGLGQQPQMGFRALAVHVLSVLPVARNSSLVADLVQMPGRGPERTPGGSRSTVPRQPRRAAQDQGGHRSPIGVSRYATWGDGRRIYLGGGTSPHDCPGGALGWCDVGGRIHPVRGGRRYDRPPPLSDDRFHCVPNWSLRRRVAGALAQVLACLAHRHACPAGGGADVGHRREQRVLPEVVALPPGDLIKQVRLTPAMEGCCGQRRVLELVVLPAAEGELGQEPLA